MVDTSPGIARQNHYVPEALLRRWAGIDGRLSAYRTLVSASPVRVWSREPPSRVARYLNLYTEHEDGHDVDHTEHWLDREFEAPALDAIDRLIRGVQLSPGDWAHMIRLVAVQHTRTPFAYIESMQFAAREIPELLDRVTDPAIIQQLAEANLEAPAAATEFDHLLNTTVESHASDPRQMIIQAHFASGRPFWLARQRALLRGPAMAALLAQRWSVAIPHGTEEWPLTDHPSLRIQSFPDGSFSYTGGWNSPGTMVTMPVSPRHLLYVRVGSKAPNRFVCSPTQTDTLQQLLVRGAHRWVFATSHQEWVPRVRPRQIDAEQFAIERRYWRDFHRQQSELESTLRRRRVATVTP